MSNKFELFIFSLLLIISSIMVSPNVLAAGNLVMDSTASGSMDYSDPFDGNSIAGLNGNWSYTPGEVQTSLCLDGRLSFDVGDGPGFSDHDYTYIEKKINLTSFSSLSFDLGAKWEIGGTFSVLGYNSTIYTGVDDLHGEGTSWYIYVTDGWADRTGAIYTKANEFWNSGVGFLEVESFIHINISSSNQGRDINLDLSGDVSRLHVDSGIPGWDTLKIVFSVGNPDNFSPNSYTWIDNFRELHRIQDLSQPSEMDVFYDNFNSTGIQGEIGSDWAYTAGNQTSIHQDGHLSFDLGTGNFYSHDYTYVVREINLTNFQSLSLDFGYNWPNSGTFSIFGYDSSIYTGLDDLHGVGTSWYVYITDAWSTTGAVYTRAETFWNSGIGYIPESSTIHINISSHLNGDGIEMALSGPITRTQTEHVASWDRLKIVFSVGSSSNFPSGSYSWVDDYMELNNQPFVNISSYNHEYPNRDFSDDFSGDPMADLNEVWTYTPGSIQSYLYLDGKLKFDVGEGPGYTNHDYTFIEKSIDLSTFDQLTLDFGYKWTGGGTFSIFGYNSSIYHPELDLHAEGTAWYIYITDGWETQTGALYTRGTTFRNSGPGYLPLESVIKINVSSYNGGDGINMSLNGPFNYSHAEMGIEGWDTLKIVFSVGNPNNFRAGSYSWIDNYVELHSNEINSPQASLPKAEETTLPTLSSQIVFFGLSSGLILISVLNRKKIVN